MPRINWTKVQPVSLTHALELCSSYARDKKNLSTERVAELMGLPSHHSLYKWMSNGRIPAQLIRPYEHACGCSYVSRYLAHSAHYLTLKVPTGRRTTARDVNSLQATLTRAVTALMDFSDKKIDSQECLDSLMAGMESLAWHHANVEKTNQPDLELFDDEDE